MPIHKECIRKWDKVKIFIQPVRNIKKESKKGYYQAIWCLYACIYSSLLDTIQPAAKIFQNKFAIFDAKWNEINIRVTQ